MNSNEYKKINLFRKLCIVLLTILALSSALHAQDTEGEKDQKPARTSFHFQATSVPQWVGNFKSPYAGAQSFVPNDKRMTVSSTYFAAYRVFKRTEVVINPEMAGGVGLSGVYGVASFPNAEAMRTGKQAPFYYIARAFVRQTIPLSSEEVWQEDGVNTIAGFVPQERLVISVGKFAVTDYIDGNSYSHDGRTQFFNWSIGTQGAYDFAADNKAYTQGVMVELIKNTFKFRYSFAQLSTEPNGPKFNWNMKEAYHNVAEIEKPFTLISGKPGVARLMGYMSANKYGVFSEAMESGVAVPFDGLRNEVHYKLGVGINLEQPISDNAGFFARASLNNGKYETWSYTQIDQSATAGFLANGKSWKRPDDKFGVAAGINGISETHAAYLAGGGSGILLGDGQLNYGTEKVFETFYSFKFHEHVWVSGDYQFAINPGYNKDRGPIWSIVGLRIHVEF
jgi:high affinity Mn2+ porin